MLMAMKYVIEEIGTNAWLVVEIVKRRYRKSMLRFSCFNGNVPELFSWEMFYSSAVTDLEYLEAV